MRARSDRPVGLLQAVVAVVLAAGVALPAALVALAPAAAAHGGEGNLALVSMTEVAGAVGSWKIEVELTYLSDGHPIDDAAVTVAGDSSTGSVLTPVTMQPLGEGRFGATVELPAGTWTLRVTSVEPPAQLALEPVSVPEAEAPATPATTGTSSTAPSATSASSATDRPASGAPGAGSATSTTAPKSDRPDGAAGTDLSWPLLALVVLVGGGVLVWAVMSWLRYRSGVDRLG